MLVFYFWQQAIKSLEYEEFNSKGYKLVKF